MYAIRSYYDPQIEARQQEIQLEGAATEIRGDRFGLADRALAEQGDATAGNRAALVDPAFRIGFADDVERAYQLLRQRVEAFLLLPLETMSAAEIKAAAQRIHQECEQ